MPIATRQRLSTAAVMTVAVSTAIIAPAAFAHASIYPTTASISLSSAGDPASKYGDNTSTTITAAAVTADVSHSDAPAGATFVISWGDGVVSQTTTPSIPVSHTYKRVGQFGVALQIIAPSSATANAGATATIIPAGGTLTTEAIHGVDRTPFTFTVTPPTQLGAGESITGYNYSFGDTPPGQTTPTGPDRLSVQHAYQRMGTWDTSVTATLNDGGTFTLIGPSVDTSAFPPSIQASLTQSAGPRTVTLDLTGTQIDPAVGSNYASYSVGWGDGGTSTGYLDLAGQLLNHQYSTAGTKDVTITVTDRQGHTSTTKRSLNVTNTPGVTRFAGSDRYATGILTSQAAFPNPGSASAVVLARGDTFADALAGIPLAKYRNAPLLLTSPGTVLDGRVANEIERALGPDSKKPVYLLGGTSAIPQSVADYIAYDLHHPVIRYAGPNRYATALDIARRGLDDPAHLVVARGDDFADALAAGPLAADKLADDSGRPAAIVLTNGPTGNNHIDPDTASYIATKAAAGPNTITAIGGGALDAVNRHVSQGGSKTTAIVGTDRYDTAAKAARYWTTTPQSSTPMGIASGTAFADALTGGAYQALENGPLLLTNPTTLSTATDTYINDFRTTIATVDLFGGTAAIASSVEVQVQHDMRYTS